MKRLFSVAVVACFVSAGPSRPSAQLLSYKDAPVRISHYHLNVTSIEAQKSSGWTRSAEPPCSSGVRTST